MKNIDNLVSIERNKKLYYSFALLKHWVIIESDDVSHEISNGNEEIVIYKFNIKNDLESDSEAHEVVMLHIDNIYEMNTILDNEKIKYDAEIENLKNELISKFNKKGTFEDTIEIVYNTENSEQDEKK
jgi:hypothetical protein